MILRLTTDTKGVGTARHDMYAAAIDQYKKANENGFYIEAICLMESLMVDRLESLANYVHNGNWDCTYESLGRLTGELVRKPKVAVYPDVQNAIQEIDSWRMERNRAVHAMGRLPIVNWQETSFQERYAALAETAKDGYTLFRALDNALQAMRNQEEAK